jgi:hypothetical protein
MTPEMALIFADLLKGTIMVIAQQMQLAGATKDQIDNAVVDARAELANMDPATLPKQQ